MNRTISVLIKSEYETFAHYLKTNWGISEAALAQRHKDVHAIFGRYLAVSCATAVFSQDIPRSEYLRCVPETANLAIVLAFRGLTNAVAVLLRQSIELTLKHIFFASHTVEYGWAQRRDGYRELSFQHLVEYIQKTDELRTFTGNKDLVDKITNWYARLSQHVHIQNSGHWSFPGASAPLLPGGPNLELVSEAAHTLWPRLTLLLCLFFPSMFGRSATNEQLIIRGGLDRQLRMEHNLFLRNLSLA